ncbi:MAG: DMT family transporter, partial [Kaistella sp.]|nr:DMT family transporter [Kaistella sp.]
YAIQYIGSTPTSIIGALEPIVAVFISVFLFQEELTVTLAAGVLLIIIGVLINIVSEDRKEKRQRKSIDSV